MTRFHHYILRLYSLHKKVSFSRFSDLGLSQGQPKVIEILLYNDGCTQKVLAELCGIQPASMSCLLKKMECDGLVRREPETLSSGVHIMHVYLTDEGRRLAERILVCADEVEDVCFSGFTEDEKAAFILSLDRILCNLKKSE